MRIQRGLGLLENEQLSAAALLQVYDNTGRQAAQ